MISYVASAMGVWPKSPGHGWNLTLLKELPPDENVLNLILFFAIYHRLDE